MGSKQPMPMAGKMLNEQGMAKALEQRKKRMSALNTQSDEMFQTLLASGQKPYRSPYEPEELTAPMSNQNLGASSSLFDFQQLFDSNRFG